VQTEQRSGQDRRTNPRGGRRADDPIADLATHQAKYVTARQIADYCDVSLQTVYKWFDSGKMERAPHFTREIRVKTDHFRLFVFKEQRRSA
jgi:AcrR family transcriptional regulator